MKKIPLLLFLFVLNILHNRVLADDEDSSPIVVTLQTESNLSPLYLSPMINDNAEFDDSYLKQLNQVLNFDFNHNGVTTVAKRTKDGDNLLTSSNDQLGHIQDWKNQNIFYVIKGRVKGKQLSALVLDVNQQKIKSTEGVVLTGNLNEDRKQIHKLSDTIHKALFNADGIASTHILFSFKTQTANGKFISEIWESDYDGSNARQLTQGGHYNICPSYIMPKPGYLSGGYLFVSYQIGQPKIYMASFNDGKSIRLTKLKGNQLMPAMSRQRDKIAFVTDVTGNPDLFIQPFNPEVGQTGKPYQIFSAKQATQGSPTFSPDGKRLAFVSDKDGSPKIYVIDIPEAGTSLKNVQATLISKTNRENTAPCWSPDGTKLAYCSSTKGTRQIWIYDFKTNQERQLTQGPSHKENPFWAPNSLHLIFNSADNNASELFIINLNQAEATQISFGKGEKRYPCWEPRLTK